MMRAKPLFPVLALCTALAVGLGGFAGCTSSEERAEAARGDLEAALEAYADGMSRAYAFTDPSALEAVAMPREIASVESNIARLAERGQRLAVDQKELTVEVMEMTSAGSALVNTLEVWDLRVMDLGSEREISRDENQESRVRYQLKKDDEGTWKVLWRQRVDDPGTRVLGGGDDAAPAGNGA